VPQIQTPGLGLQHRHQESTPSRSRQSSGVQPECTCSPGKDRINGKARSLFCYWAVRKLGYSEAFLAKELSITQPALSMSVKRGETKCRDGALPASSVNLLVFKTEVVGSLGRLSRVKPSGHVNPHCACRACGQPIS